jgi:hypothetical protein
MTDAIDRDRHARMAASLRECLARRTVERACATATVTAPSRNDGSTRPSSTRSCARS